MDNNITAIIDYGVGNLFSLRCSLASVGANVIVTGDKNELKNASRIILPGVGAFEDAMKKLLDSGMAAVVCECAAEGKPIFGICLGMQLLFDNSLEYGNHKGLGLIPGAVVPLKERIPSCLKVPHIGWNSLKLREGEPLFKYLEGNSFAYYVHSFYADTAEEFITAKSEYGIMVTGAVRRGNVWGTQFHPEKSGKDGLLMLKAFCEEV